MQHGWRWQRSTFGSVSTPLAARRAGAGPTPLLCFAVVEAAVMPVRTSTLVGAAALIVVVSASWRMSAGFGLNHVGCPPSWTYHVPHRDSYRDPCHQTCGCLYPGALWTVVSVPNYTQGASPT